MANPRPTLLGSGSGVKAVENTGSLYDFNATILHVLGLSNTRLTDVHGHVIKEILA